MIIPKTCPKCSGRFVPAYIEEKLPGYRCQSCEGVWLSMIDLDIWLSNTSDDCEEVESKIELDQDNSIAMRCPFTGALMLKYRFSAESERYIEYSPLSGAIWLDKGEWSLLKSMNLVREIPHFFNKSWQKQIVSDSLTKVIETKFSKDFGDDYDEIKKFKSKFYQSGKWNDILTYLKS